MSRSTLAEKLRIKDGSRTALLNAPKGFAALLDPLPEGAAVSSSPRGGSDVVLDVIQRQRRSRPHAIDDVEVLLRGVIA